MSEPCIEVAIVGGGLAGCALAQALLVRGLAAEQLQIIDARRPEGRASGVPWALMHPLPGRSLFPRPGYLAAWQQSLDWLQALASDAGDPSVRTLPVWRLALEPATAGRFARSWQRALESLPETSPAYPLQQLDPAVWPGAQGLYGLQQGRLVQLPAVLARLQASVGIQHSQGALRMQADSGGWLLQDQNQTWRARQVILACGSGLKDYCSELPLDFSFGEVASFRLDPDPCLLAAISASGYFITPLGQGLYHGGATHYAAARPWPLKEVWRRLQTGLDWVPGMAAAQPVSIWNGQRCGLRHDREPVVGRVPRQPGLWVMGGFSTRGLLLIPQAANALAAELLGEPSTVPAWMRSERFY